MFKKILSLFLTLSLVIPSVGHARRTEMSYERFVHLTNEEQEKLIVLTMEMMAEIEENYTYETSTNGYSEELHEKYTFIMKKLYDFLISEANATEAKKGPEWKYYAEKFREAVDTPSPTNDKCFFAGWPSRIQDREVEPVVKNKSKKVIKKKLPSTKVCVVPTEIQDKDSPEYKAYKEHLDRMEKKDKCQTDQISCNPSIFGFKNSDQKSVFCVSSTFGKSAENASHSCMKKALAITPEEGADDKDKRLKFIRDALKANPDFLKSIYEYTEKLCLCNNEDVGKEKGNLNEIYLQKIKPHRTCFAMVEMMGQTLNCGDFDGPKGIDLDIFRSIMKFTQDDPKLLDQNYKIETHYREYLQRTGESEVYRKLCQAKPEPKPAPKPEPAPKPVEPVKKPKTYVCKEVKDCVEVGPNAPATPVAEGAAPTVIISCSATVMEESEGKTILAKAPAKGEAGKPVDYEFPTGAGEEKATVSCKLPDFKKEVPPKPCRLKLEGEENEVTATVALDEEDSAKFEMINFKWGDKPSTSPSEKFPISDKKITVTVEVELNAKEGGKIAKTSCTAEKEPKKIEEGPKLMLTDGDLGAKTKTAIAKVEGKADGWKIIWEAKGEAAPDIQEEKKVTIAKDADDGPKTEETPKSKKFTQIVAQAASENKVEQPRAKADYQICAKLVKHGKSVPGDKCITVPKLEEDAPSTQASTPNLKTKSKNYPISQPQQRAPTPNRENSRWSVYGSQ